MLTKGTGSNNTKRRYNNVICTILTMIEMPDSIIDIFTNVDGVIIVRSKISRKDSILSVIWTLLEAEIYWPQNLGNYLWHNKTYPLHSTDFTLRLFTHWGEVFQFKYFQRHSHEWKLKLLLATEEVPYQSWHHRHKKFRKSTVTMKKVLWLNTLTT